jgi:hypothetical protein
VPPSVPAPIRMAAREAANEAEMTLPDLIKKAKAHMAMEADATHTPWIGASDDVHTCNQLLDDMEVYTSTKAAVIALRKIAAGEIIKDITQEAVNGYYIPGTLTPDELVLLLNISHTPSRVTPSAKLSIDKHITEFVFTYQDELAKAAVRKARQSAGDSNGQQDAREKEIKAKIIDYQWRFGKERLTEFD